MRYQNCEVILGINKEMGLKELYYKTRKVNELGSFVNFKVNCCKDHMLNWDHLKNLCSATCFVVAILPALFGVTLLTFLMSSIIKAFSSTSKAQNYHIFHYKVHSHWHHC